MSEPFGVEIDQATGARWIVGHGVRIPATDNGHALMSVEMLEQLFAVARLEASLPADDGERIAESEQKRRARERIEAAKADIMERLDLDEPPR